MPSYGSADRQPSESFEGSRKSARAGAPPGEPATVADASNKDTSIRVSELIHLWGRPAVRGPHELTRTHARHRHTHTGTEHKLGPKAPQGWAGRRRAEDPPRAAIQRGPCPKGSRRIRPAPTRRRSWARLVKAGRGRLGRVARPPAMKVVARPEISPVVDQAYHSLTV